MRTILVVCATIAALLIPACSHNHGAGAQAGQAGSAATPRERAIQSAIEQTEYTHRYDPSYVRIDYPGGDVPIDRGACSDVIVRSFRKAGVDLQKEIHEDMTRSFSSYSNKWGAKKPDSNIDHRRVQNLMTYFERKGKTVPITDKRADYLPGDLVAWDLGGGLLHIGMVTGSKSWLTGNNQIVHNIGAGARLEDALFSWKIIGHYRYFDTPA
jgi:uncharacterized protein YijF (DUF1287 family)